MATEKVQAALEPRIGQALLDIAREISHVGKLEETLQLIADRVRELLGVDFTALATTDEGGGAATWRALAGYRNPPPGSAPIAPGRGTAGRAIAARRTVILEDIGVSTDLPVQEFPFHSAEGARNAIGVPLMIGERVIGVLIAGNRSERKVDRAQIGLAEAIGAQAAIAIENARLFTELTVANQRLLMIDRVQAELIVELSTPILEVRNRILLVPVIGALSAARARVMTDSILERTATGAEVVILDITGASITDAEAAHHLHNTAAAVGLLGATCIVTGIKPALARSLVHLGITLNDLDTRRNLSEALDLALAITQRRQP